MKVKLITFVSMFLIAISSMAQDMILHYDFSNVEGTSVKDLTETGATAKLMSGAKVIKLGKYYVIATGSGNGYLDMTSTVGAAIKSLGNFTISCYYYIDESSDITGAGNFLWSFSTSTNTQQTSGAYTAYRVNVQRMASSAAGWGGEVGFEVGTASVKGQWVHVLYRQNGAKGELFLNGKVVKSATNMPLMSKVFTTTPQYCFLGKPAFSADNYLKKTYITDFRIYNDVLDDATIATLSAKTEDITNEHLYGDPGDFTALKAKIAEINDFIAKAGDDYAKNAVAELQDEVSLATNEVSQGKLSQIFIDKRVNQLTAAYNNCIKTKGFSMLDVPIFSNTDHGFRHPGGMHTQADFDRIKQLLAEKDPVITKAWEILCANEYSSSSVETWPTWEIWRSGSGDNYMNVARGAAMAYQNALRWRIAGTEANARNGVRILMKWARENDHVSGNTNMSLAFGLYGYALAQAAELLRDYPGWSPEDFNEFCQYIRRVWYPGTIDFLRRRHDTWANPGNSHGERPGHYWSNWGLCCALATMSYGVLLDDVHMYNQGMSFYKYDHINNWNETNRINNTKNTICNQGCNEFLGNLVPALHDDARGIFGKIGQMQESGRDQGHTLMALGLALDICQQGLSQGDDLFAYMDDRLAAGIEYVAGYNHSNINDFPWTPYNYADRGAYLMMGWQMDAPNEGSRGGWRPIWYRAVGYYEGMRGVTPTYAKKAAEIVGIDGGGGNYGQTSGGFDHLGFSALTSYRKKISPEEAPVILGGKILYKGEVLSQTDLGGLKYTHKVDGTHAIPCDGAEITLMPQLPEGVEDNGSWRWEGGETTRNITVKADHSQIYRVYYTGDNGAESVRSFSIAVAGDCGADIMRPEITVDGIIHADTTLNVFYGKSVILYAGNSGGWSNEYRWDNGYTGGSIIVIPNITSSRTYTCQFVNQGGHINEVRFHLNVKTLETSVKVNGEEKHANEVIVNAGDNVSIEINIAGMTSADDILWSNGNKGKSVFLDNIQESMDMTATYEVGGEKQSQTFSILVYNSEYAELKEGKYFVRHIATDTYMTNDGESKPSFKTLENATDSAQIWYIYIKSATLGKYSIRSCKDDRYLTHVAAFNAKELSLLPHIFKPVKSERIAISSYTSAYKYWMLNQEGQLTVESTELTEYPFELIPADEITAIDELSDETQKDNLGIFTITGQHVGSMQKNGVYIVNGKKIIKR